MNLTYSSMPSKTGCAAIVIVVGILSGCNSEQRLWFRQLNNSLIRSNSVALDELVSFSVKQVYILRFGEELSFKDNLNLTQTGKCAVPTPQSSHEWSLVYVREDTCPFSVMISSVEWQLEKKAPLHTTGKAIMTLVDDKLEYRERCNVIHGRCLKIIDSK